MSALTIPNNLPAELVVLSSEVIDRIDALVLQSIDLPITTFLSTKPADLLHKEMRALVKEIEAGRKTLTAPLDAIKAQAIEAERMGTQPLQGAIDALGKRIKDAVDAHNRELERQRLAALEEQRLAQEAENKRADEARRLAQEQADLDAPPGEPAAEVSVVIEPPRAVAARYVPAPARSAAVRNATEYTLEFVDRDKVPAFSAAGHELRTIDEGALKKFLKSLPEGKQEIAGAVRLVKSSGIAAKG